MAAEMPFTCKEIHLLWIFCMEIIIKIGIILQCLSTKPYCQFPFAHFHLYVGGELMP